MSAAVAGRLRDASWPPSIALLPDGSIDSIRLSLEAIPPNLVGAAVAPNNPIAPSPLVAGCRTAVSDSSWATKSQGFCEAVSPWVQRDEVRPCGSGARLSRKRGDSESIRSHGAGQFLSRLRRGPGAMIFDHGLAASQCGLERHAVARPQGKRRAQLRRDGRRRRELEPAE